MNINRLIEYFDLGSHARGRGVKALSTGKNPPREFHWWSQWLALIAGIMVEPFFTSFRNGTGWKFDGGWGWIAFSLVVSAVALPGVYKKGLDEKPYVIALCSVFTLGLGWKTLVATALKAGSSIVQ